MSALRLTLATAIAAIGFAAGSVVAAPVLQIGAPAGEGDTGTYADYQPSTTDPKETDTAITSGGTLYVAGVYNPNTILLGGKYPGGTFEGKNRPAGSNWTDMIDGLDDIFNEQGAILVVSVPDSTLATALASVQVNGLSAFYSSATESYLGDNHAPAKDGISDFLFFNIGNFTKTAGVVPNFDDESGEADGQIKTLAITGFGDLDWAHFDVMALETDTQGKTQVKTSIASNPNSKDVTWKPDDDGGGGQTDIPEPGPLSLIGLGLMGLWFARRKTNA